MVYRVNQQVIIKGHPKRGLIANKHIGEVVTICGVGEHNYNEVVDRRIIVMIGQLRLYLCEDEITPITGSQMLFSFMYDR